MIDKLQALAARDQYLHICHQWNQLRNQLQPTRNTTHNTPTTGTKEQPLPIDAHISDLLTEIETTTRFYAQILAGETTWQPTTSTMPGLLREVATRYGHFTTNPDDPQMAEGFCNDADHLHTKVTKVLTKPQPPKYIGPCPTPECDGELSLKPGTTATTCPHCRTTHTESEQQQWLDTQMQERLMTLTEIGHALKTIGTPTNPNTIRQWAKRGRLVQAEEGLYKLQDAHNLARKNTP